MPPQPMHGDGAAGFDLGGMEHGAHTGHHAAADQGGAVQRDVLVDLDHGMLVDQHLFGEHRQVEHLVQHLAFPLQPPSHAGQQLHLGVVAQVGVAGGALRALAAEHRQAGDDVVAGLYIGDVLADGLDHRGAFVAQDGGSDGWVEPLHEVQVGVAEAGVGGAQQDFAALGFFDLHVLNRQGLVRLVKYRSLHVGFLRLIRWIA